MARARARKTSSGKRKAKPPHDAHVAKALRYIDDVLSGRKLACKFVQQACKRQLDDLERFKDGKRFYFDERLAGRPCRFLECLPHIKGPKANAGEKLVLEDWQCFILTTIFGWRRRDTGGRRFRRAYVEVPRGNGKSAISSGIALYGLTADGESGAEVYSAATTKEQARIVFDVARMMLDRAPGFADTLGAVVNKIDIRHPKTNSVFRPMSREAKNQDGANLHVGIVDELHAHRTREIHDVLETAMAKRLASLLFEITTAGSDTSGICYEVRSYVVKLLDRIFEDETQFGIIFTIDEGDLWTEESSWIKANPNWGVSVQPDEIAALARKAMQNPAAASNFQTKHLDVWVNADQAWMDMRAWDRCANVDQLEEEFEGQECIAGLDLATKVDIAAKARLFWRDGEAWRPSGASREEAERLWAEEETRKQEGAEGPALPGNARHYYAFVTSYLPEAAISDGRNSQYSGWEIEGRLRSTPGDVLDFAAVKQDLLDDQGRYRVREVAYDPWQAQQLANELAEAGLTPVEMRPTVANFSAPMKELDALVRAGRFHHDGNPVLRWMVSNVVCHTDAKDNIYPRKQRPENKIDGVVALIMALGRAMVAPEDTCPYSATRGLLSL